MRVFLAIDIPNKIKQSIEAQLVEFKDEYPYFSWVTPENFHITVAFLGEMISTKSVEKVIEDMVFEIRPFRLFSEGVDLFLGDKITIFLNFYKEKALHRLMKDLQAKYSPEQDKEVVSHLTIARYKVPSKQQYLLIKKKIHKLDIDIEFPVSKLILYQSILGGKRPVYKQLAKFPLLP